MLSYKSVRSEVRGTVAGGAQLSPPVALISHVPPDSCGARRGVPRSAAARSVLPFAVAAPVHSSALKATRLHLLKPGIRFSVSTVVRGRQT